MSYIDDNLMPEENVIYRANLHWIIFVLPIIVFILFFLPGAANLAVAITNPELQGMALFGGIMMLIGILPLVFTYITRVTSEFGLTNKRILVKVGFIRRKSIEVLLTKVEGIQVEQGIIGRMLGFGSIVITGTGGAKSPFRKISAPLEFRKSVQEQIARVQE